MTSMHPRISLHQVAFAGESTTNFIDYCRGAGIANMTLVSYFLAQPGAMAAASGNGPRTTTLNHPFALFPNLEAEHGGAAAKLLEAIETAAGVGARLIYLQTGGRGGLDWEQAAARFCALIAP